MDRRSFLQATAAIVASSAVSAIAGVTNDNREVNLPDISALPGPVFTVSQECVVQSNYWKYDEALRLYDEAVAAKKFPCILMTRVDKLLKFVHDNFERPVVNTEEIALTRKILGGYTATGEYISPDVNEIMNDFRRTPPVIQEVVWPIAMMLGLLRVEALPINHRALTEFKTWHDRYGELVLA